MSLRPKFAGPLFAAAALLLSSASLSSAWAQSAPPKDERQDPHARQRFGGPPPPRHDLHRDNTDRMGDNGSPNQSQDSHGGFGHDHGFGRGPMRPGPHAGDWLRKFKDLSPAEQERSLNNDPHFQQLPPDHQQHLRERLRQFNSLPPEQKQKMVERMEKWDSLSPEEKQRIRDFQEKLRAMPEDRRNLVRREIHGLAESSPEERRQTLGSDRYKTSFNDEERSVIEGMMQIEDPKDSSPPHFDF